MDPIAKIIFEALAAGRGVNLPEVGAFYIERDAAKFISKNEIRPPHNRVLFSRKQDSSLESVIDMMVTAGAGREEAGQKYAEWLAGARSEKGIIEIGEVGVLKNDFFYPSVALHDALNPGGQKAVQLPSGNYMGRKVLTGLIVLVSVAVVLFFIIALDRYLSSNKQPAPAPTQQVVKEPSGKHTKPAEETIQKQLEEYAQSLDGTHSQQQPGTVSTEEGKPSKQPEQAVATTHSKDRKGLLGKIFKRNSKQQEAAPAPAVPEKVIERVVVPTRELEETPSARQEPRREEVIPAPQPTVPVYHVVAGVFVAPENAEKLIAQDHLRIGRQGYRQIAFKDKIMVVVFSSTDKSEAENRRRELLPYDYELWLYAEK